MNKKNKKLMVDGNAFYEVDLECVERKERQKKNKKSEIDKPAKKREKPGS